LNTPHAVRRLRAETHAAKGTSIIPPLAGLNAGALSRSPLLSRERDMEIPPIHAAGGTAPACHAPLGKAGVFVFTLMPAYCAFAVFFVKYEC